MNQHLKHRKSEIQYIYTHVRNDLVESQFEHYQHIIK